MTQLRGSYGELLLIGYEILFVGWDLGWGDS